MYIKGVVISIAIGLALMAWPAAAISVPLPDHRAYELVSNLGESGESALNGAEPHFIAAAESGETVDWAALGACCGAGSGGLNTYQSTRGAGGWLTEAISPTPAQSLAGLELQTPVFATKDLSQTIFLTPASYAAGDARAQGSGGSDLYLRDQAGALSWLSQGPFGDGSGPYATRFGAATANAETVVFGTAEELTANATGLAQQKWAQYLYARDVPLGTTSLIDVNSGGSPIGSYGATLGDAGPPPKALAGIGYRGSVTNALSGDGSKVFFETPPAGVAGLPEGVEPHLYMRDLENDTTTPLDDPAAVGSAHYQGAAENGSLVFFTSDEGLDGAPKLDELYAFNTTAQTIGRLPAMSSSPLAGGAGVLGVTAIANDGSRVFFIAPAVLATNANPVGGVASAGQPNLYVYETGTGETSFIATLAPTDVSSCEPTCASTQPTSLISTEDISRPAYTTPSGSVLVFASSGDLTGESHVASTTLTAAASPGEHTITVASTAGFMKERTIAIGSGDEQELATVERIDGPTELTLTTYGPTFNDGLFEEHQAGTVVRALDAEIYRYSSSEASLVCLSCTPAGVPETASASLGEAAGGSYAPDGDDPQMSESGSRIFFDSPDPLVAGAPEAVTVKPSEPTSVYEWEDGRVYLLSGAAGASSVFDGTTPSGGDVFFSAEGALTPGVSAGFVHIYDAREGGGLPAQAPPPPTSPCAQEECVQAAETTPIALLPASATLGEENPSGSFGARAPTFTVDKVTAAQRASLARSGRLPLTIKASAGGIVLASASTELGGKYVQVASAGAPIGGAGGGLTLVLKLDRAARAKLSRRGVTRLRVEVRYQAAGRVDVARFTVDVVSQG
jgi:hypothetical protein